MNKIALEKLGNQQQHSTPKRPQPFLQDINSAKVSSYATPNRLKAYSEDFSPAGGSIKIKLQRRSNLATNLSIGAEVKVNNTLSREEREIQKLERILEIEKQRAEHAKLKQKIIDH